ncbi:hypothetical protein ACHHYP_01565 [Achlya hypogyna]|uniref:Vacuolar membrane protease n=1 Tax=Achlya hypogyna TaxID=1202772 RepID=A0A1V9Z8I6_ACHHY|nr:hypothetical protein ACHHYP_01565 [Achlya hypogyna]
MAIVVTAAIAVFTNVLWRSALPPALGSAAATATHSFAGAAAYATLLDIASAPHPVTTADNYRVYNYLYDELLALTDHGLVLESPRANLSASALPTALPAADHGCANVSWYTNTTQLIARVPGTSNTSVLLTAHFDSVPTSYGASDDGAGVAVVLHVLRALLLDASGPRTHGLVVFLDNGEENGLCGARWFTQQQLVGEYNVKAFVNVEAGGAGGRAILFRATDDALASLYAAVAPYPHMNSLGGSLISVLGSATDFEVYQPAGVPGVDIAFYEHREYYHSPADSVDHITPEDLQHCGANVLAYLRALLATESLTALSASAGSLYFDLGGEVGITLTTGVRGVIVGVAVALALVVLAVAYWRFPLYDSMIAVTPKAFALSILGEWTYIVRSFAQALMWGLVANAPVVLLVYVTRNARFSWLVLPCGFVGNVLGATAAAHRWRHGQPHPNVNAYVHFASSVSSCSAVFALAALVKAPVFVLFALTSSLYSMVLLVLMAAVVYVRYRHDIYGPDDATTYIPTRTAPMYYSTIKIDRVLSPRAPQLKVYVGLVIVLSLYMLSAFQLSVDIALAVASVGATDALVLAAVPALLTPTLYPLVALCAYWEPNKPSYRFYYYVYVVVWVVASAVFFVLG